MPSYIVKVERGVDLYCMWSTITDCPTFWGTKAELQADEYLQMKHDVLNEERWARADDIGTSAVDGYFGWDDDQFIVMNMTRDGMLKRTDLRRFLESIHGNGTECDTSLLTPFEHDEVDA